MHYTVPPPLPPLLHEHFLNVYVPRVGLRASQSSSFLSLQLHVLNTVYPYFLGKEIGVNHCMSCPQVTQRASGRATIIIAASASGIPTPPRHLSELLEEPWLREVYGEWK